MRQRRDCWSPETDNVELTRGTLCCAATSSSLKRFQFGSHSLLEVISINGQCVNSHSVGFTVGIYEMTPCISSGIKISLSLSSCFAVIPC